MFWEANLSNMQLLFLEYLGSPEKGLWGYETHPDWLATEEADAVEAVLWW